MSAVAAALTPLVVDGTPGAIFRRSELRLIESMRLAGYDGNN